MDAVIFETKGAHLALQRVARRFLRAFGITPARFDLMHALGSDGMKQSDLWRRLNVVRSVVCEMVGALEALGWVKRVRAADSRTWWVRLTRRGRALFECAYECCVETGDVAVHADCGLTRGHVELDAMSERNDFLHVCDAIQDVFQTGAGLAAPALYVWQPEDYYHRLIYGTDDVTEDVPFVSLVGSPP